VFSKKHSDEREIKNFKIEKYFLDFFFKGKNMEFGFLSSQKVSRRKGMLECFMMNIGVRAP